MSSIVVHEMKFNVYSASTIKITCFLGEWPFALFFCMRSIAQFYAKREARGSYVAKVGRASEASS